MSIFIAITNHACERYLERILGFVTWTKGDINNARKQILNIIYTHKHKHLDKKNCQIKHVLINEIIMVFAKAKKKLITLYPSNEEALNYFLERKQSSSLHKSKVIENLKNETISKRISNLGIKGNYPDPKLLSFPFRLLSIKRKYILQLMILTNLGIYLVFLVL